MSFMNPVDMVDEDAADLQFPKAKSKQTSPTKIVRARIDDQTNCSIAFYKGNTLHKQIEQLEQLDSDCSSVHISTIGHGNGPNCATCRCNVIEPYIKCSECLNTLLCLHCFARGQETGTHRSNHAYIIVRDDIQVFADEPAWTANDERILLQTLRTQGYGNWEAVARALQQGYSKAECQRHYHDCYFGGIFERLLGLQHTRQCYFPERMPYVVKMRALEPPRQDDISSMQFKINAGYRCARGDFDTPYDASAEGLLAIMLEQPSVTDDDDGESILDQQLCEELQCALVRAYNNRLRERKRRYAIMRQHGLIMPNRTVSWIAKYTDAFPTDANCMRFLSFMQICQPIQFDLLVESLRHYRELQSRLYRLYELRQQGVRSMYAGALYARLHKQRQQAQRDYARQWQCTAQDWQQLVQHYEHNRTSEPLPPNSSKLYALSTRRKAGPMEIADLPGYGKLNADERKLCSVARLVPQAYLDYKNQLIAEHRKLGHLRLGDARRLIKIDVNKTRQIYDFLLENGHISRPQAYG